MLKDSDFHGRFVHPQTGIEYEDFGAYFQQRPREISRNYVIRSFRRNGATEAQLRAYWQAYDAKAADPDEDLSEDPSPDEYHTAEGRCHLAGTEAILAAGYKPLDLSARFDRLVYDYLVAAR